MYSHYFNEEAVQLDVHESPSNRPYHNTGYLPTKYLLYGYSVKIAVDNTFQRAVIAK